MTQPLPFNPPSIIRTAKQSSPAKRWLVLPVLVLLLAAGLRFAALGQAGRFHPDEALFATFARSAALKGDWLLPGPLDKPPLSIYVTALSMALLVDGEAAPGLPDISPQMGEFAARLPNVLVSLLVAALSFRLARRLYGDRQVALWTLALVAFSPFSVTFAATAFTDGWLLLGLAAALVAVSGGRWGWAGLGLGLAFWSKQQALFYLPLLLVLGVVVDTRPGVARRLGLFLLLLAVMVGLLVLWDGARGQPGGVWALAAANNDPWRLLRSDEVWPRLQRWATDAAWLLGFPVVTLLVGGLGLGAAFGQARQRAGRRRGAVDVVLLGFVLAYFGLHWLVAFNLYDRYLLLLLLPLALLAARGLSAAQRRLPGRMIVGCVLGGLLVWGGLSAALGAAPLGADRGDHDGIDLAARWLDERTLGAIIYDHWLGWELDYYLGTWTDKRRVYYPSTGALADGARHQPDPALRYFIVPAQTPHERWLDALRGVGFGAEPVYDSDGYVIYALRPPWAAP